VESGEVFAFGVVGINNTQSVQQAKHSIAKAYIHMLLSVMDCFQPAVHTLLLAQQLMGARGCMSCNFFQNAI
jgi:hypothetical protein